MTTIPSTALVLVQSVFTESERQALAGPWLGARLITRR
jgi:hypothetical protein